MISKPKCIDMVFIHATGTYTQKESALKRLGSVMRSMFKCLVKVFRKGKLKLNGWFYKQELLWKNPQSNRRRMTHGYKWLIKKLCIPVKWSMDNPVVIGYIVCGALCVFAVTLTLMLIGMLMAAIFTGILTAITYVVANAGVFITFAIIATVIWLARP